MPGRALVAWAALLTWACGGPQLQPTVVRQAGFSSNADCSQGPFKLVTTTLGGKWGEGIAVVVSGPSRMRMHVDVKVDEQSYKHVFLGNGPPENDRCVFRPEGASSSATTSSSSAAIPTGTPPSAGEPTPTVVGSGPAPALIPKGADLPSGGTVVFEWAFGVDPVGTSGAFTIDTRARDALTTYVSAPLPTGKPIEIVIWSDLPNDFRGATIALRQYQLDPPKPEAEWMAYLKQKKAEADAERAKASAAPASPDPKKAAETEAERKKHLEYCATWEFSADCADVRAATRRTLDEAHENYCKSPEHMMLPDCEVVRDRIDAEARATAAPRPDPADTKRVARWCAIASHKSDPVCAPPAPDPKSKPADRPPPPPMVESKPPKPSENAEWIPGMWVWDGTDYQWTSGGWRVPESDRIAKKTPVAPTPPPPDRVETIPPPPVKGAVWVPGYWHWDGSAWTWVPGNWRMPPPSAPRWRRPVWIIEGGKVRLDPGGWEP